MISVFMYNFIYTYRIGTTNYNHVHNINQMRAKSVKRTESTSSVP